MNFLMPAALLALVAWLLPILIHLSRRSEPTRTDFAALRWLKAHFKPRKQPVVQEWPLLIARLLLLLAVVLWLAAPIQLTAAKPVQWWLVAPGLDAGVLPKADATQAIERRWLASGFPELDSPLENPRPNESIGSLLRELDAELPDNARIRVWLPTALHDLDADRIRLSRNIDWQVINRSLPRPKAMQATAAAWLATHADVQDQRLRYFRAAYGYSQNSATPRILLPESRQDAPPTLGTAWLRISDAPLPATALRWVRAGGQLLVPATVRLPPSETQILWRDENGAPVLAAKPFGQGRVLQWQQPLRAENLPVLERAEFAERLHAILSPTRPPHSASAASYLPTANLPAWPAVPQSLRPWLLWLIALLLLVERYLATRAKRWVAA